MFYWFHVTSFYSQKVGKSLRRLVFFHLIRKQRVPVTCPLYYVTGLVPAGVHEGSHLRFLRVHQELKEMIEVGR